MKLTLFFTRDVSLRTWDKGGMLEREVAIYRALLPHIENVTFVTYGDANDLRYADHLDGIGIICNRWNLPRWLYVRLISHLYPLLWRGSVVLKSNQVQGADIALQAAKRFGKKFIARCGYLHSEFVERQHGVDSREARLARALEQKVFVGADRVVVTTLPMQHAVVHRYQVPVDRVTIIPNYVDTDIFCPKPDDDHSSRRICFVGRLDEQKNPFALLEAIKGLDVELVIVGNGPLGEPLRMEVDTNGLPVRFLGNVPHSRLPQVLNSAALFVLPSHYEGHPKALLEAMACGLPVIGTDVPGIRELIVHDGSGCVCDTDPDSIRAAIQESLARPRASAELGRNARQYVIEHFGLDRIVEMELAVLREVVSS